MTLPIDLVLMRHGQSEVNLANERSRRGDESDFTDAYIRRHASRVRLTAHGCEQIAAARTWLLRQELATFDGYYCSDYVRAKESAARLRLSFAAWGEDFAIRERDWGMLETLPRLARIERFAEELERRRSHAFYWRPPGGESIADVCVRVEWFLRRVGGAHSNGRVIAVSHGEALWAFRMLIERLPVARFLELQQSKVPQDYMRNSLIIHYTRRNPEDPTDVRSEPAWMRRVYALDPSLSPNRWEELSAPRYTNEELLASVEEHPHLVTGGVENPDW